MQLIKNCIIVSLILILKKCASKIVIIEKTDEFAEIGEAAIKTLTTCYGNTEKSIVLLGDFPENFVEKLSSHRLFSPILLNEKSHQNDQLKQYKLHKTHLVVMLATSLSRFDKNLQTYSLSSYDNSMASLMIICWSITKKHECSENPEKIRILHRAYKSNMLNANLLCRDRKKQIKIYSIHPFENHAPKPWQPFKTLLDNDNKTFYSFIREFREDFEQYENLDFDKTRNLNGRSITTVSTYMNYRREVKNGTVPTFNSNVRIRIQEKKRFTFIDNFIKYVNATRKYVWQKLFVGVETPYNKNAILTQPYIMRVPITDAAVSYPHGVECKFIVTQFRGNKSQLRKILDVIDIYSWFGMFIVYFISVIFFKYFWRRPFLSSILDLLRLVCGFGLRPLPSNGPSQIYLSCLLFFLVTMQGIFEGNLAALLTQDIPVRQVNSVQDLADFGYTIFAHESDFIIFENRVFEGRVFRSLSNENCLLRVKRNSSIACLTLSAESIEFASKHHFHVSNECVLTEYVVSVIPKRWELEERLIRFLGITIDTATIMPLDAIVAEKRLLEAEAVIYEPEPRIMVLDDLGFAFALLGIGLTCAIICFITEQFIYRREFEVSKRRIK